MDIATLAGLISGIALILVAIFLGGGVASYINLPGALIVLGGTLAATFIRFTFFDLVNSMRVAAKAFFVKTPSPESIIQEIIFLSHIARKEGILRLEKVPINDPFLRKAVMYCVDGYQPEFIAQALDREIEFTLERHGVGQSIFIAIGETAPAFGLIGTLIGLVALLGHMKEPSSIGPSMSVALLTTLYGAVIANLIALPIADKLKRRSQEEELNKRLVVEGILGLQKGLNPKILEEFLNSFLPAQKKVETVDL
ncbi:MAG: MotA/TolQ/ExbB proton channel family protein [Dissulfurimicrobium sp.]|uniref:MotA/TolQ/ExbB proton channel family protein n=1 Tax=Dissulfurimicrobium TaxID=1769732 RepID=UPI001EDAEA13|nr:MotA/TolQ/ExbB proton channel family protein [Dissulfurimicrobium hydrothermale]UKL13377.1 MotA/TolQ/ExbB proton channel family protein [Dissulfurimicrobium hydrothermale]